MRSFAEVFSWSEEDRKILFEVSGWWLYTLQGSNDMYFTHGCDASRGGDIIGERQKCVQCGEMPPDDFLTVATLMHKPKKRTQVTSKFPSVG